MQKGLISIITPCYNTGDIVHRLLDSILLQDYPNVEMFAIDDGSTDNTKDVIKSYINKFSEKGYTLNYVRQDNGGQSAALNNGLKLVKGEFLIWPDSDDYFRKSYALSMFVRELQKHDSSYAVVRCVPTYINEKTLKETVKNKFGLNIFNESQFENCLFSTNFFWGAGNYMVKMEAFDKVNPLREIYVSKDAGQNWQMLLAILYSYKCITIDESLFNILERDISHSRGQYRSYEQKVSRLLNYKNTILFTLNQMYLMPAIDINKYKKSIDIKYKLKHLKLSILHKKEYDFRMLMEELTVMNVYVSKEWIFKTKLRRYYLGKVILKFLNSFMNDKNCE